MAGLFKKAFGLFVEFEEENPQPNSGQSINTGSGTSRPVSQTHVLNAGEIDKFEKHFEKMFDQANLPGPDYYEFWKTMETLEAHIPDEKARISATFASLSIQGLTKDHLLQSANKYKELIEIDKSTFEKVVNQKSENDIGQKRKDLKGLEEKIAKNAELIKRLTQEITEAQTTMGKVKAEIAEEETKLANNKNGYIMASQAMINKIVTDVQKIQSII
jgi:chromosome segregation ATPase